MEDRETRFKTDVARLSSICEDCVYLQVKNFADDTLQLKLLDPGNEQASLELSFSFSIRDYPEGTVLSRKCMAEAGNESAPVIADSKNVLHLVAHECQEFCKVNNLEVPLFVEQFTADDRGRKVYSTQISRASGYTDTEGSDMDDYDNYDGCDDEDLEDTTSNILEQEIVRVHHMFGLNSLDTRHFTGIDEVDLLFNIDLNNLLDVHTASGWGVDLDKPLVILLHVQSSRMYPDGPEPLVEVFQAYGEHGEQKKKTGVGVQMRSIVEKFVSRHWKEMSHLRLEEAMASTTVSPPSPQLQWSTSGPKYQKQASLGAQITMTNGSSHHEAQFSLKNGFLAMVFRYALNRILSLNEYCVICDERHVIECGLMKTLGVMADSAASIAADGNVVDLLITMANAAACSTRNTIILNPYPSIVDPDHRDQLALDPNKTNFILVKEVMQDIVKYRMSLVRGRTAEEAGRTHRLSFPLMQWIIATCRAHIVFLPEDRQLKSMSTKYQFLLISSPPNKEAAFKSAKEKHGSQFAFHGSNVENWHSILRKGLINASGSELQLHGAAHGSGVYLSPNSGVSFNYTGHTAFTSQELSKSKDDTLVSKVNLKCVALCEVVSSKKLKKSGDIWVMPDSDHVCTRFFFVYDSSVSVQVKTSDPSFKKEIDHAVAYIHNMGQRK